MNPRPILITLCGAVAFVALCYFGGKQVFEQGHIKDTSPPTVPKYQGQVDNAPKPTTHPNDTPATNSEQITHVTPQPAPTVNTEIDNATQEAETPTTTSNHQSPDSPIRFSDGDKRLELLKSIRLLGEEIESYGDLPSQEQFQEYADYISALQSHLNSVRPLNERMLELETQYIKSMSPDEFAEAAALFRQEIRNDEPDITDEEIETFLQELKP